MQNRPSKGFFCYTTPLHFSSLSAGLRPSEKQKTTRKPQNGGCLYLDHVEINAGMLTAPTAIAAASFSTTANGVWRQTAFGCEGRLKKYSYLQHTLSVRGRLKQAV